jgi:hypothetical protein
LNICGNLHISIPIYRTLDYIIYYFSGKEGIRVEIFLSRRLLGTALTIYLPTILMNIIGEAVYKLGVAKEGDRWGIQPKGEES